MLSRQLLIGLCGAGLDPDTDSAKYPGLWVWKAFPDDPCEGDHCTSQSYIPSEHWRQVLIRRSDQDNMLMYKVSPVSCIWHRCGCPHQTYSREKAWGHSILQGQTNLAWSGSCLGLLGLCAPRASLRMLLEWPPETLLGITRPQQSKQGSCPNTGLSLLPQVKWETASVWEAISLQDFIQFPSLWVLFFHS